MRAILNTLRNHLPFIIIAPLLVIVMTWPTAMYVVDVNTLRWPVGGVDILMKFWDAWYGKLIFSGQADYFYTDLLFHPRGLSLAYHSFSLPNMIVFGGLQGILPPTSAYMLTYLLTLLTNATAAYAVFWLLFRSKWAALVSAVVFGLNPYTVGHATQFEVVAVATIPIALYALQRGILEKRAKWLVVAAALCGITAFIGMYNFVCLMLTVGAYTLYLAAKKWREPRFWKGVILLLAVAGAISMLRIYPMIANARQLDEVLDKNIAAKRNSDLLAFLVYARHPLASPVVALAYNESLPLNASDGYLGLVPLSLVVLGFLRPGYRRQMIFWLAIALFFASLRLGTALQIGGVLYADILLPKHYLDRLFPWLFKGFWDTAYFQIGLLFPFAILVCYSLIKMLASISPRWRTMTALIVLLLVAFEYFGHFGWKLSTVSDHSQWMEWLGAEDNQDSIGIVNLPMGRRPSKLYGFYQTLNGYPHAEGLASRTPNETYTYIDSNYVLQSWKAGKGIICRRGHEEVFYAALDQLLADGFTHIVVHNQLISERRVQPSFVIAPSSYEDAVVTIYRMQDLRQSCNTTASLGAQALLDMQSVSAIPAIMTDQGASMLSIQAYESTASQSSRQYLTTLYDQHSLVQIAVEDVPIADSALAGARQGHVDSWLSANSILLFVYDPKQTSQDMINLYGDWISRNFKFCEVLADTGETVIEHYIHPDFPCALAIAASPVAVDYDNGIQLGNLLKDEGDGRLDLYFLWKTLPSEVYSMSVQLFDDAGLKVLGRDFVIGHDPFAHHRLDTSTLRPGDYVAKLILYNYDTGVSLPGTVARAQVRFDRELEIARLTIE